MTSVPIVADTAATVAAIGGYEAKLIAGAAVAVHEGTKLVAAEAKAQLEMHGSHPRGTPTPSPAGTPPAMIDGHLSRSITPAGIIANGFEVSEEVGPAGIPYARVQELGGQVHHSTLPARPYMRPALDKVRPQLSALFAAKWVI